MEAGEKWEKGFDETHCPLLFHTHLFLYDGKMLFKSNEIFDCSTDSCHCCSNVREVSKFVGGN